MIEKAGLRHGETILVHAGTSGVGSAAIQIARLKGARVVATVGSDAKCEAAKRLGADHAINYQTDDFVAGVRDFCRSVDVVFEHVGGSTFEGSLRCLARGGRLVTCGTTDGEAVVEINLRRLFFKNLVLIGNTMGSRVQALQVIEHAARGELKPVIDTVLPMIDVGKAHERLETRAAIGKVIVTP